MAYNPREYFFIGFHTFVVLTKRKSPEAYVFSALVDSLAQLLEPAWLASELEAKMIQGIIENHPNAEHEFGFADDEAIKLNEFFNKRGGCFIPVDDDGELISNDGVMRDSISGRHLEDYNTFLPSFPVFNAFGERWRIGSYRDYPYDEDGSIHAKMTRDDYRPNSLHMAMKSKGVYHEEHGYSEIDSVSQCLERAMKQGIIRNEDVNQYVNFFDQYLLIGLCLI